MTYEDAITRLAGCRAAQPGELQVIVSADIVDALIAQPLHGRDSSSFSEVATTAHSGPQNAGPWRDERCRTCRDVGAYYCTDCGPAVLAQNDQRRPLGAFGFAARSSEC